MVIDEILLIPMPLSFMHNYENLPSLPASVILTYDLPSESTNQMDRQFEMVLTGSVF